MTREEALELLLVASRKTINDYFEAMVLVASEGGDMPITDAAGPTDWIWAKKVADARHDAMTANSVVAKIALEKEAIRQRLVSAMDEGTCIGTGREGEGCGYVGKSGDVCPRCNGMVLSPREVELADLRADLAASEAEGERLRGWLSTAADGMASAGDNASARRLRAALAEAEDGGCDE